MRQVADEPRAKDEGTLAQARQFADILRSTPARVRLMLFAAFIVAVIVLNAFVQVRLNIWQGGIYDSIAQRDLNVFLRQLGIFGAIVSVLLVLGVAQTWLQETLKVKLREAVTFDLIDEWLRPRRAYRMALLGEIGAHPDQRLQDDTRRLTELSVTLGVGLIQSTLLLIFFIGVLWMLSNQVVFATSSGTFTIPGYMVWAALVYATLGSWLTWLVGRPLIPANSDLRAREAEFRYFVVRVDQSAEAVATYRGEEDEHQHLTQVTDGVFATMQRIANALARLNWVTAGYGWLGLVVPIILAAPGYFSATLSIGGLIMVVGAFLQVQQALRWFVDQFPSLAEWGAVLARVMMYRSALKRIDNLGQDRGLITYADHPQGHLSIDGLRVFGPNSDISLAEPRLEVAPGERVLLAGTPRCGKSTFFRALAGLWVWGEGKVSLPQQESLMFLPNAPYIPLGTLREALTYPAPPSQFKDEDVVGALFRVRLQRLMPMLDTERRWDQVLSPDEQQRIAIARALLHRPKWIIQDEAMSELDEDNRKLAESIFSKDLGGTALISVGKSSENGHFYSRVLNLKTQPPGSRTTSSPAATRVPSRHQTGRRDTRAAVSGR
jgi:vitamin B12/bleomycin/antimicrobial peptide transport system ATP-binding/permease protein